MSSNATLNPSEREMLERWYVTDGMSTREIGQKIGASHMWVQRRLKALGIPRRAACGRPLLVLDPATGKVRAA